MSNRTRAYIQQEIDDKMTFTDAIDYFRFRLNSNQCGMNTKQRKAFELALYALEHIVKERTDCQWK